MNGPNTAPSNPTDIQAAVAAASASTPLEPGLQPDRVHLHQSGEKHVVVIDAGFAGATVRVVRREHPDTEATYEFLKADHSYGQSGWTIMPGDGAFALGVVAAGDHWARPGVEHGNMYAELGEQTRDHLLGLVDSVATKGTAPPREPRPSWRAQWPVSTEHHRNGRSL